MAFKFYIFFGIFNVFWGGIATLPSPTASIGDMATYKVEQLPSPLSVLGEGPHWDVDSQSLYYCDIYGKSVHRYVLSENKTYTATVDVEKSISFIIPVDGTTDEFAIGNGRKISVISWDGKSQKANIVRTAGEVETGDAKYLTNRFNDAKSDPTGRFYGGTMRYEECGDLFKNRTGSLYKYDKESGFEKLKEGIAVSNGLTWDEKKNKMYYIDSCDVDVKSYDYDSKTGNISNEKVVIDFKVDGKLPGFIPDGMTIDSDGKLYVATWGGSKVIKVDPITGKILMEIKFPCEQVTSAAFGGPNLDILFVTSAATDRDGKQAPEAGALFAVKGLGVKGLPMTKVKV